MEIEYDVEPAPDGTLIAVARLRLPEKMARTLIDEELPELDRPVRFAVTRGARGSVRAATLRELQELLDRPWSPGEDAAGPRRSAKARVRQDRHGARAGGGRHRRHR